MKTEFKLLNSIFGAAYGEENMEKKTKEYLDADFQEKTRIIKTTAKIFQNMHIDPKRDEINDNYDKALTAQWASFWLVNHYHNTKQLNLFKMINIDLEIKLRSKTPRVRGYPGHFYT